jgi:hypothetical protein
MSFSVAGNPVQGVIVSAIQSGKGVAEQVVQQAVNEVKNDPAKTLRDMQQPSGLSSFLDIKI